MFSVCGMKRNSRLKVVCFLLIKLCYNFENIHKLLKLVYTFLCLVLWYKNRLCELTNLYLRSVLFEQLTEIKHKNKSSFAS